MFASDAYINPAETGFYYLGSRYYNPEVGRFINADTEDVLSADYQNLVQYNLYAYCWNNPINMTDETGAWPNSAKIVVGALSTVAAVTLSVATGGAALPILASVALNTVGSAVGGYIIGGKQGAIDGAANGFMLGGLCAIGGSVISGAARTIKNAKSGITIGKVGTYEDVAALAKTRHYSGLKEFNFVKKVAGQKAAEAVGWWQNKCVVKGVMALKGAIYDCGGALTGAYAKEVVLTKGYQYLYNVWLM